MADKTGQERHMFVEGYTNATLVENRSGTTSKGYAQCSLRFKFETGPDAGYYLWWSAIASPNNTPKQNAFLGKTLRTVGWDGTPGGMETKFPEKTYRLKIRTKPAENGYDAKSEIEFINSLDDHAPEQEPMSKEQSAKVASALYAAFGAVATVEPTAKNGATTNPDPLDAFMKPNKNDDIPF